MPDKADIDEVAFNVDLIVPADKKRVIIRGQLVEFSADGARPSGKSILLGIGIADAHDLHRYLTEALKLIGVPQPQDAPDEAELGRH
jgi:hypothetical protein